MGCRDEKLNDFFQGIWEDNSKGFGGGEVRQKEGWVCLQVSGFWF